ncbi:MAG: glycerol-3-phosphate dehydrogenase/oxidase, partial [Anaerolineales bacterium]|nr:glycerol-3-phosphate dehydrogenase/oxidase [Anaerolineales bacterium]
MKNRSHTLYSIKENPKTTALIIGAGINGIGTFRDLALQGVDCLIVDRGDFCSGASMASSHMLHGGIRYLENGEFRLVREALHERNNLLRNAPHLTHPLPTTIPLFKWFSGIFNSPLKFLGLLNRPAERGAVIIKLGLMMYDAYVRGDSPMPGHHFDNRKEALKKWPALNPAIRFAATYFDGAMESPERLALDILLDGEAEGDHARAVNYVRAVRSEGNEIILRDEITGDEYPVIPEIVINAGGPWIDFINEDLNNKSNLIGGTKGSHLVIDHPELRNAIGGHEIFFEYVDGRIVLIFPYLENHVMIGSTDIRIDDPDNAVCTEEEIEYILGMVPQIFPSLNVTRDQIVFQFSGVRPLPTAKGSTGQISRDHSIDVIEKSSRTPWPILNLVGGKWTSYRALSEQVTDLVLSQLDRSRKASTACLKIGGGTSYPASEKDQQSWIRELAETNDITPEHAQTLFERYGTRASGIAAFISETGDTPLKHLDGYSKGEVRFLVEKEM